MDSPAVTASELARQLGISLPRAHRLLDVAGVPPAAGRGYARHVDPATAAQLLAKVGSVPQPADGLNRVDMLVLAAVSRAGLGLESARAVARAAGVSPTAAGKSLRTLEGRGLIVRRERRLVRGRPRTIRLWQSNTAGPAWTPAIKQASSRIVLPTVGLTLKRENRASGPTQRIPGRFAHLFWNADFHDLDPSQDGDFIASRMMTADDPDAWAWAITNLSPASLLKAATLRGLSPRRKALIENLALSAGAA